jgi:hypothetical protein
MQRHVKQNESSSDYKQLVLLDEIIHCEFERCVKTDSIPLIFLSFNNKLNQYLLVLNVFEFIIYLPFVLR